MIYGLPAFFLLVTHASAQNVPVFCLQDATKDDAPRRMAVDDLDHRPNVQKIISDLYLRRSILQRGLPLKKGISRSAEIAAHTVRTRALSTDQVFATANRRLLQQAFGENSGLKRPSFLAFCT